MNSRTFSYQIVGCVLILLLATEKLIFMQSYSLIFKIFSWFCSISIPRRAISSPRLCKCFHKVCSSRWLKKKKRRLLIHSEFISMLGMRYGGIYFFSGWLSVCSQYVFWIIHFVDWFQMTLILYTKYTLFLNFLFCLVMCLFMGQDHTFN